MQAYCVKCRAKRELRDVQPATMSNGKAASRGICTVCGTSVFKIGAPA